MPSNQSIEYLVTQLSISQSKRTLNIFINHTNNSLTSNAIGTDYFWKYQLDLETHKTSKHVAKWLTKFHFIKITSAKSKNIINENVI